MVVSSQQGDLVLSPPGSTVINADEHFDKPPLQRWHFLRERITRSARRNFLSRKWSEYPNRNIALGVGGNKTAFGTSMTLKMTVMQPCYPGHTGNTLHLCSLAAYPVGASKRHKEARCQLSSYLSQCSFILKFYKDICSTKEWWGHEIACKEFYLRTTTKPEKNFHNKIHSQDRKEYFYIAIFLFKQIYFVLFCFLLLWLSIFKFGSWGKISHK